MTTSPTVAHDHDTVTTTVDAAAAYERWRADPEPRRTVDRDGRDVTPDDWREES